MPLVPFDKDKVYYVIIGCGFSAITNHAILQFKNQRIRDYTVLHIGSRDPWASYIPKPMGQWPALLSLPGYMAKPASPTASSYLASAEFGQINQSEWGRLLIARPFSHVNATVTSIVPVNAPPTEYQLILDNDPTNTVRAAFIDVCGGPGPAKEPPSTVWVHSRLETEYKTGIHSATPWPRLVSGERYLTYSPGMPSSSSVCVIGGGATSAWCVEHAQMPNTKVLWLSKESLNSAFVSSHRNDGLVSGAIRRTLVNGEHVVEGVLKPRNVDTIFAEGFEATSIDMTPASQQVRVHFHPILGPKSRYVNRRNRLAYPAYRDFDRVVYSIGQQSDRADPKSWFELLKDVLQSAITRKTHIIRDRNHRAVGLWSDDKRVRVLGASALSHPDLKSIWSTAGSRSNLFFRSLTEQARVRIGITLAALTIAEANEFWVGAPNENLNTAGLGDLQALLTGLDKALDAPQAWFEVRGVHPPIDTR